MYNFRCKICGAEFEKMPKICPTPGCGNRNPAMWENIAPAAPRPVLTDEELRELERRKSEERRRLEAEEKARLIEQQRAAEVERQRELDRLRYEEQQRQQAEAEERRRLEAEEKARRLEQQRAAEAERQRELDRLRYEEQQRIQQQQTGGFSGFGNTVVNVPQAQNEVSDQNNKKIIILLLIITLLLILLFAGILLIAMMKKSDRSRTSSKYSVEETTTVQTKKTKKTTESTTTTTKATTTTTTTEKITTTTAPPENDDVILPELIFNIQKKDSQVELIFYAKQLILPDTAENIWIQMYYLSSSNSVEVVPDFDELMSERGMFHLNDDVVTFRCIVKVDDNDVTVFGAFKVEYDIGDTHYTIKSPIQSVALIDD